ncbi:MAG: hypothetical protein KG028_05845 [Actinobacteria bacterium]|jgi:hypothetical protein|nr:hypothetical protein [Actinomycetota bacterium]
MDELTEPTLLLRRRASQTPSARLHRQLRDDAVSLGIGVEMTVTVGRHGLLRTLAATDGIAEAATQHQYDLAAGPILETLRSGRERMAVRLDAIGCGSPALAQIAGLGYHALATLTLPVAPPAQGVLTVYLARARPPLAQVLPRLRVRRAAYGGLVTRELLAFGLTD